MRKERKRTQVNCVSVAQKAMDKAVQVALQEVMEEEAFRVARRVVKEISKDEKWLSEIRLLVSNTLQVSIKKALPEIAKESCKKIRLHMDIEDY